MRIIRILLLASVALHLVGSTLWARTLYLRVAAGEEDEGAIFIYHLQQEIPEQYRKWIVDLDYGPDDQTIVVPNLPDRVYRIDLAENKLESTRFAIEGADISRKDLENMVREIVQDLLKKTKGEIASPPQTAFPIQARPERGNLWE